MKVIPGKAVYFGNKNNDTENQENIEAENLNICKSTKKKLTM